jgi:uncharacterized protein GlcG (DUF336 family)
VQIKSTKAASVVAAATRKAVEIGVAVTIVVLDGAGHLKAFSRMDGAWLGSIEVAHSKAKTSVLFQAETQALWDVCKPGGQAHGLEATNGGLITFAGGIPLKTFDESLSGAIGVSGGQVDQDYAVARAGAGAFDTDHSRRAQARKEQP